MNLFNNNNKVLIADILQIEEILTKGSNKQQFTKYLLWKYWHRFCKGLIEESWREGFQKEGGLEQVLKWIKSGKWRRGIHSMPV